MRRRSGDWKYERLDPIMEVHRSPKMRSGPKLCLASVLVLIMFLLLFVCYAAYSVGYNGEEGTVPPSEPGQLDGSIGQNRTNGDKMNTAGQQDEVDKQVLVSDNRSQSATEVMEPDNNTQTGAHVMGSGDDTQTSTQVNASAVDNMQVLGFDEKSQTSKQDSVGEDSQNNTHISQSREQVLWSNEESLNRKEVLEVDKPPQDIENQELYDLNDIVVSTDRPESFVTDLNVAKHSGSGYDHKSAPANIPKHSGSSDDQESAKYKTTARPVLSKEMVQDKIDEVAAKIRNGNGDKVSWQFILQMLQHILKDLDKAKAEEDREDGEERIDNSDEKNLITLENPLIARLLGTLKDSPQSLDKYDFTKPLVWDFPCLFLKLGLKPEPEICFSSQHNDVPASDKLSHTESWEKLMLDYFIQILRSDSLLQAVDLGSSLGMFSLSAAALGRPVLAVECSVRNILPFHKSIATNHFQKYVTLVTNCLSDTYKLVELIYGSNGNFGDGTTVEITKEMLNNDIIDPKDVVRTVTLNDLPPAMVYKRAVMKVDLQGDEASVFGAASHFFQIVHVHYVLMHWRYASNPGDYDVIFDFLKKRYYVPYESLFGKSISDSDMKKNQPVVVWKKD